LNIFEDVEPRKDFTEALAQREKEERPIPGAFWSLAPILVPVLLITLASFATALAPESAIASITTVLGDRIIAMGIGVAISTFYALYRKDVIPKLETGKTYSEMIFGDWVGRAITMAALPLIITSRLALSVQCNKQLVLPKNLRKLCRGPVFLLLSFLLLFLLF